MAPAKSIKLSKLSRSKLPKSMPSIFVLILSLKEGKKYPESKIKSEKIKDDSMSPIAFGSFRILKLI
jgi:hypothetical protein